ncbi:MAG: hypothetical protein ACK4Y7_03960 [Caldimicrobium sp.]
MKKIFLFLNFLLLILWGCASYEEPHKIGTTLGDRIKNILVLPMDDYCISERGLTLHCPVGGVITGEIESGARELMDNLLKRELQLLSTKAKFYFLTRQEFEALLEEALDEKIKTHEGLVRFFMTKTNSEALLYGKILRFRERKGSSWSVVEPASVAFVLTLYDGATGRILWQKIFDETQKPLSENLLNLPLYGKIKWLKAEELAERGLKNILKTFPY